MKIRIYVSPIYDKIFTEDEFFEDIEIEIDKMIKDNIRVEDFLKNNYCYYEIFNFSEEKKEEVLEDMRNCFMDEIFEDRRISGDWIYKDIEIEELEK